MFCIVVAALVGFVTGSYSAAQPQCNLCEQGELDSLLQPYKDGVNDNYITSVKVFIDSCENSSIQVFHFVDINSRHLGIMYRCPVTNQTLPARYSPMFYQNPGDSKSQ
jgi:hypothetical protein